MRFFDVLVDGGEFAADEVLLVSGGGVLIVVVCGGAVVWRNSTLVFLWIVMVVSNVGLSGMC